MSAQGSNARKGSAALAEVQETPLDRVKGTTVEIDGESVLVGKLGLNQLVALARVAGQAIAKGRRAATELAVARTAKGDEPTTDASPGAEEQAAAVSDGDDVVTLLSMLDEPTVCRLVGVVIQREEAWVGQHVDALALVEVADALLEHNNWKQLQQAVFRLGRRFQNAQS